MAKRSPTTKRLPLAAGQRFGRLVAIRYISGGGPSRLGKGKTTWLFRCDCGREIINKVEPILSGQKSSCKCLQREMLAESMRRKATTHGMTLSREYASWRAMLKRCTDPNHVAFSRYKDIAVCKRWHTFENFYADMGPRPEGYTLHRVDNDLGYFPANCKWATRKEQERLKSTTVWVTFRGRQMSVAEACELVDATPRERNVVYARLKLGWDIDRALATPIRLLQRKTRKLKCT